MIPKALTLGFARRFATYKRPDLLLHDPPRLLRLLANADRPVQLILAGKAHPADQGGQALIQKWIQFIRRPEVRPHAIFLSDYDMLLTEHLVQGVDVWINTPRRPWEASGTSGMKVLVNGGINLSELDGWWAEAYTPEVGWALGDGQVHGDDPAWDAVEAGALYDLLEREVIPEFYTRDRSGIPSPWVKRMRQSMARLTPRFSANRTVREYTEQRYLPAAAAYRARAANKGEGGRQVVEWLRALDHNGVRCASARCESTPTLTTMTSKSSSSWVISTRLRSGSSFTPRGSMAALRSGEEMISTQTRPNSARGRVYRATVPAARPASDYTTRVIPKRSGVAVPLESAHILWQRMIDSRRRRCSFLVRR